MVRSTPGRSSRRSCTVCCLCVAVLCLFVLFSFVSGAMFEGADIFAFSLSHPLSAHTGLARVTHSDRHASSRHVCQQQYCVQFKKGVFDLGATIVPVAIKYKYVLRLHFGF